MKRLILAMVLVCGIVGVSSADDVKGSGDGGADTRQGGESFGDAVVIPSLPFSDTGATCDNSWDVDLSCGYTAGISPDVFYSYTACVDGTIGVSLCGSTYDTQVAIFDAGFNELACNDDSCGLQSEVALPLTAGGVYYIMVSGFFGACGNYTINVNGPECPVPTNEATWGQVKSLYR